MKTPFDELAIEAGARQLRADDCKVIDKMLGEALRSPSPSPSWEQLEDSERGDYLVEVNSVLQAAWENLVKRKAVTW